MAEYAGMPPIKSSQIVGGSVTAGLSGPYITDFTLSTPVDPNKSIIIPLTLGNNWPGTTPSGDYFKWSLTSGTNLRAEVLRANVAINHIFYFLVLEFYAVKGKVAVATNVTGTAAADFNVSYTAPPGASLARMVCSMTCVPADSQGNIMKVSLVVTSLSQATFKMQVNSSNTTKPVQGEILFF